MWTEGKPKEHLGISKKHFETQDLYVNSHHNYTKVMPSQGNQNLVGLSKYQKNILKSEI